MEAGSSVSMRFITVIARRTPPCEALFFIRAKKLHTNCRRTDFWKEWSALYLGSSRCARPLPLRLCRPCRSSHSLHSLSHSGHFFARGAKSGGEGVEPLFAFLPRKKPLFPGNGLLQTSPEVAGCCQCRCQTAHSIEIRPNQYGTHGVHSKETRLEVLVRLFHKRKWDARAAQHKGN